MRRIGTGATRAESCLQAVSTSMYSARGVTVPRAAWRLSGRAESHTRNGGHAGILVVKDIGISTLMD